MSEGGVMRLWLIFGEIKSGRRVYASAERKCINIQCLYAKTVL